ncbi:MAG: hypothetical protein NT009_02935 [Proteobacteria bacterium]|nr:hypothetical protein [Pseudomonadota bacterium]
MLSEAKNFRVVPSPGYSFFSGKSYPGYEQPGILFDYGMKTIGFARGIDEAEAAHILNKIKGKNFLRDFSNF